MKNHQSNTSKNLILIFTRNPELGKGKTRLAATVGKYIALEIYKFLLSHTRKITKNLSCVKQVWYTEKVWLEDEWSNEVYDKKLQKGTDLGLKMKHAFQEGFEAGFENIIIIGSDMFDLKEDDLEFAFKQLETNDFVLGPAEDGGYYLLGMKRMKQELFQNKEWGTNTVLKDTLNNLEKEKLHLLQLKNDVDIYEDIKDIEAFQPYLKDI